MVAIVDKSEKKVKGRNFAYEVNGLQIFAMGADYIPEDNILTRQNRARKHKVMPNQKTSFVTNIIKEIIQKITATPYTQRIKSTCA